MDRARRLLVERPVVGVAVVALVARLAVAVVSFRIHHPILIPDEGNYLSLATWVQSGRDADGWQPGYGQYLYDTTWGFVSPLVLLFHIFGPSRLVGQLLAVAGGVACAGLTAVLGRQVAGPRLGLAAGLVVALLPSQVFFSSVVLRESMVWSSLVLIAIGLVLATSGTVRRLAAGLAAVAGGLWLLGMLRDHTAVAAAWAVVLAVPFVAAKRWQVAVPGVALIAIVVPALTGSGPFGVTLVREASGSLSRTRAVMALDADTGFAKPTPLQNEEDDGDDLTVGSTSEPTGQTSTDDGGSTSDGPADPNAGPDGSGSSDDDELGAGSDAGGGSTGGTADDGTQQGDDQGDDPGDDEASVPPEDDAGGQDGVSGDVADDEGGDAHEPDQVGDGDESTAAGPPAPAQPPVDSEGAAIVTMYGEFYQAEPETFSTNISHLPTGLGAMLLRPFPWEQATSSSSRLATVENLGWLVLYALAVIGGWALRRRWRRLLFPLLVSGAIVGIGALSEGNLGTAFRHRGQVAWAIALLAAAGVLHVLDRLKDRGVSVS